MPISTSSVPSLPLRRVHTYLQKANNHADDAVAAKTAGEHLAHATLTEKMLRYHDQWANGRHPSEPVVDISGGSDTITLIDANVHAILAVGANKLDNGDLGFGDHLDIRRKVVAPQAGRHTAQHALAALVVYRAADYDKVDVAANARRRGRRLSAL